MQNSKTVSYTHLDVYKRQEQGWFTSYGKAFGNWLYEFFIYDIHRPDVKNGQQHLKALKELTQAYGFSEQIRSSKLWRELSRV